MSPCQGYIKTLVHRTCQLEKRALTNSSMALLVRTSHSRFGTHSTRSGSIRLHAQHTSHHITTHHPTHPPSTTSPHSVVVNDQHLQSPQHREPLHLTDVIVGEIDGVKLVLPVQESGAACRTQPTQDCTHQLPQSGSTTAAYV